MEEGNRDGRRNASNHQTSYCKSGDPFGRNLVFQERRKGWKQTLLPVKQKRRQKGKT
jgi:hypothetical protein